MFLVFCVVQDIALNHGYQGKKSGLKVKILPKCVRPHLVHSNAPTDACSYHGCTQHSAGPSSYLRSNARDLRSNACLVSPSCHSSYLWSNVCPAFDHKLLVRSNVGSAFERTLVSHQPINRTSCILLFFMFGRRF